MTIKKIAEDIARGAQMELFWDADEGEQEDRIEQTEESDLSFLQKLCDDHGLALKVSAKKLSSLTSKTTRPKMRSLILAGTPAS